MTAAETAPTEAKKEKSEWWRAVLGEYPTGVALITSLDAQGSPVGMVVGTFTAISQHPPLIGFLPDNSSTTYPHIAANGSFCVSVLGTAHEELCRRFFTKDPARFDSGEWAVDPHGIPRLRDAIAWFDADITQTVELGDHRLVVGAVTGYGTGNADSGLPLLFRRAGYGSFQVPTAAVDARRLSHQVQIAERSRSIIARLSESLGVDVLLSTVVRDSVVLLSVVRHQPGTGASEQRPLGVSFPFVAPLAPAFVAWADPPQQQAWIEGARHLIGSVDRAALSQLLANTRARGYSVSTDRALGDRFERLLREDGRRESYAEVWSTIAEQNKLVHEAGGLKPQEVNSIQAPAFGPDGAVDIVVTANDLPPMSSDAEMERIAAAIVRAANEITALIGGRAPSGTQLETGGEA